MTEQEKLGWRDAVVVVTGTPWDGVPSSERQLADELAKQRPVVWLDPAMPVLRAWRNGQPTRTLIRRVSPNVVRVTPATVPGPGRPVLRAVATRQRRQALRRALQQLDVRASAIIVATLDDLLDVPAGAVRTFYGTDDYVAGAALMGVPRSHAERGELRQLSKADLVLAVSEPLCARWAEMGVDPVFVPNGTNLDVASATDEAEPANDVSLPGPIAGFVGHVSDRIDVGLLLAVARAGVSVLLVGPITEGGPDGLDDLLRLPNVAAVGRRSHAELPSYYRLMDVGLTPYTDTEFNRASFPLKTLEYLAAGLPVVSTPLPAVTYLGSNLVVTAAGPSAFAAATADAARTARDPELVRARRNLAENHSWGHRADQVLAAIELTSSGVRSESSSRESELRA